MLKLFFERDPWHKREAVATMAAFRAGIPVPRVIDSLIEVDNREGIVFERLNGPLMAEHLEKHPEELESCARKTAELLVQIHSVENVGFIPIRDRLIRIIKQAECLDEDTRQGILDTLNGLPIGDTLCHGDYHFRNIIMSGQEPIAIDWATGGKKDPLYDYSRTKLMMMNVRDTLIRAETEETAKIILLIATSLKRFTEVFCQRYQELRSIEQESLTCWQMVAAAVRAREAHVTPDDPLISLVKAVTKGTEHPWL